jgi:hypothetical protein
MDILQLVSKSIPYLSLTDKAGFALDLLETHHLPHLPVIESGDYQGMVNEEVLIDVAPATILADLPLFAKNASVNTSSHVFDLIRIAEENGLEVIAVGDMTAGFLGCVLIDEALRSISATYSFRQLGGILVLSVYERDYSLNYLSRLIEGNDVKILSSGLDLDPEDPQRLLVTLKLDKIDLSHTIATLERFGIEIYQQYHVSEKPNVDQERLEQLLKYLSM